MKAKCRSGLAFLLCPCVILYEELLLRAFAGKPLLLEAGYLAAFSFGAGALLTVLLFLFRKHKKAALCLFLLLTGFAYTSEGMIFNVYRTFMSPGSILAGAGAVSEHYRDEAVQALQAGIPQALLHFLPLLAALALWKMKKTGWLSFRAPVLLASLLAALFLTCFAGAGARFGRLGAVYDQQFDFSRATETLGLATSLRLSSQYALLGHDPSGFTFSGAEENRENDDAPSGAGSAAGGPESGKAASYGSITPAPTPSVCPKNIMQIDFSEAEKSPIESVRSLTEYVKAQEATSKNEYTGLFKGKNLILICAEALTASFADEEMTPALYRLIHNGFYFSEYYHPEWGGSTTTGEVSFLLGLAPHSGDESMFITKDSNNYFTMGNQLQREGYNSCAFHAGAYDFYHRNETHENLGYDQFIANDNGLNEFLYPWAWDADLIGGTMDLYLDKQPFSIYYMTASGHAPYREDHRFVKQWFEEVDAHYGEQYLTRTKYYICYQMKLEEALEVLLEKLEDAGLADDTVIALVGDHFPYGLSKSTAWGNDKDYVADLLGHGDYPNWLRDENSLVIWSGCLENENKDMACEIDTPVFSLDILPTLSNLFGLPFDSRLLPGRDVFSEAEPLVYWSNLSWVTERGKYDSYKNLFYPNEGFENDPAYTEKINETVRNKILMSRTIEDNDYYGILFGPDTLTKAGEPVFVMPDPASSTAP